jgi:succinoglycan biosynthesis transport protein ExoP
LAQYDINLREYWRILKKRKFVVIFTAILLAAFSTAFAVFRAPTPIYTSVCSIKFEKETTVEGLFARTLTWSGGDDIETQISIIKSYSVFEKVGERLGLIQKTETPADSPARARIISVIDSLQSKVEVTRQNQTNILHIKVKDKDPAFAQRLANAVSMTYKDMHSENQLKRTTEAIKYIEEQLVQVRQKLKEAEEEFNRFTQNNQLLAIDLQSEKVLARTQDLQNEIRRMGETKSELQGMALRLDQFIANPSSAEGEFHLSAASSQYQSANSALTELQLKKDTLLKDFTALHPEVVEVSRRISENAKKMRILLQSQIAELDKKVADAKSALLEVDNKSNALMEKKLEYDRLKRKVVLYNDMTTLLERKNQEAQIRKAEKPEEVSIVKPALFPSEPINPPKTAPTGAMGLLIGIVIGMIAAFIIETFDTSIGAIEDVEETLKTPVWGVIPQADVKELQETLKEHAAHAADELTEFSFSQIVSLVSHFAPKSMVAESFRALRTNVQGKGEQGKMKTLAITSASPQEGKTLVSVNLAIAMAQAGLKTLLVGSDLRKPVIGRAFGVELSPGLSEILLGNLNWREVRKTIADILVGKMSVDEALITPGLDNLHFITAGAIPPNPAELIESKHLMEFIEEARKEYQFIIFDSPPILSTADAAILGSKMDAVLLVYRIGAVSRGLLKRSTTQLEQVKSRLIGVILNGMKPNISPDFQDLKYYRYYYSHGEGEKTGDPGKRIPILKKPSAKRKGLSMGSLLRALLVILVLAAGTVGVLWYQGVMNPLELAGLSKPPVREPVKHLVRKTPRPSKEKSQPVNEAKAAPPVAPSTNQESSKPKPQPVSTKPAAPASGLASVGNAATGSGQQAQMKQASVIKPLPERKEQPDIEKKPEVKQEPVAITPPGRGSQPETRKQIQLEKPPKSKLQPKTAQAIKTEQASLSPAFPYSLYLGSVKTLELAKRGMSKYEKKGLSPYRVKVNFKEKGEWYRIFVGHFKDREEAEAFARTKDLRESEVLRTEYANLIGVYSQKSALNEKIETLSDRDCSPYAVTEADGKARLFVGAYVTREAAEEYRNDLKSSGVDSQVVKR